MGTWSLIAGFDSSCSVSPSGWGTTTTDCSVGRSLRASRSPSSPSIGILSRASRCPELISMRICRPAGMSCPSLITWNSSVGTNSRG